MNDVLARAIAEHPDRAAFVEADRPYRFSGVVCATSHRFVERFSRRNVYLNVRQSESFAPRAIIDAVDGPYGDFKDEDGYRREAGFAKSLGMVGKWAIHPSQIAPGLDIFSPKPDEVERARKMEAAYREAEAKGLGAAQVDGVMIDIAVLRFVRNTLDRADLYGM